MSINAALKETDPGERRVAMVPSVVDQLMHLRAEVAIQSGAGDAAKLPDTVFKDTNLVAEVTDLVKNAVLVLSIQPPPLDTVRAMKPSAVLVSIIYENNHPELVETLR